MSLLDMSYIKINADNLRSEAQNIGLAITEEIESLLTKYERSYHLVENVVDDLYQLDEDFDAFELIGVVRLLIDSYDARVDEVYTLDQLKRTIDAIDEANSSGPDLEDDELVGLLTERVAFFTDLELTLQNALFIKAGDKAELGEYYFETISSEIPEKYHPYFDTEAYGRDCSYDGTFVNGSVFVTGY